MVRASARELPRVTASRHQRRENAKRAACCLPARRDRGSSKRPHSRLTRSTIPSPPRHKSPPTAPPQTPAATTAQTFTDSLNHQITHRLKLFTATTRKPKPARLNASTQPPDTPAQPSRTLPLLCSLKSSSHHHQSPLSHLSPDPSSDPLNPL